MSRDVVATVSLPAIEHNAKRVKSLAPHASIMAMVKANAYGHGLLPVSKVLEKYVAGFGVACMEEAVALREAGIKKAVLLTQGVFDRADLELASRFHFSMVVHHEHQLSLLKSASQLSSCWLKFDSGMSRLGFSVRVFPHVLSQFLSEHPQHVPVLMTHFANAENPSHELNALQQQRFLQATDGIVLPKSACNSAALYSLPSLHYDWVRPGIMLYGISPFANRNAVDLGLKPVMQLKARLIAIKELDPGDVIGYGSRFECKKTLRLGVVNIGYGDGYPRHASD